jgi:chromosome segregation ATPase
MIDRAFAQSEYDHARQQRDEWRDRLAVAQAQLAAAQQAAQQAQAMIFKSEGAVEQAKAYLDRFAADAPQEAKP